MEDDFIYAFHVNVQFSKAHLSFSQAKYITDYLGSDSSPADSVGEVQQVSLREEKPAEDSQDLASAPGSSQICAAKSQLTLDINEPISASVHYDTPTVECRDAVSVDSSVESPESFSSFMYWREPLPQIDIVAELSPSCENDCDGTKAPVIKVDSGRVISVIGNTSSTADATSEQDITTGLALDIQLTDDVNTDELNQFLESGELYVICCANFAVPFKL